jgi:hypothetical protein
VLIESMEEVAAYIHGGQGAWQACYVAEHETPLCHI